jgi:uncharacterized protein YndB with AHSA1/START domain
MEQTVREKPFLVLNRSYAVAPEKVWRAWTDPEAIRRWWGPGGPDNRVAVADLDVRVGGRFRIVFGGKEGNDHEVTGIYVVVQPHKKLSFTWTWPRTTPERESVVTIVFKEVRTNEGQGTELEFKHEQLHDESVRDGHKRGWTESLAKLDDYLRS